MTAKKRTVQRGADALLSESLTMQESLTVEQPEPVAPAPTKPKKPVKAQKMVVENEEAEAVFIRMPKKLKKRLKIRLLEEETTITDYINSLVERSLSD